MTRMQTASPKVTPTGVNVGRGSGVTDRCVKVGIIYKCECRAGFRDDGQVCEGRYYIQV